MSEPTPADPPRAAATAQTGALKGLAVAAAVAAALLVLVVLPAERNLDPTGFGRAIGITVLSAPPEAAAGAAPAKPDAAPPTPAATSTASSPAPAAARDDRAELDLPPGRGLEYKFRVAAGAQLTYEWTTGAGDVHFDFHGEPAGAAKDVFQSYAEGRAAGLKGVLTAPFEGTHGWYWRNVGTKPVRITLVTSGAYEVVGIR